MDANLRANAWVQFAAAVIGRNIEAKDAAVEADKALEEFDKRNFFGDVPDSVKLADSVQGRQLRVEELEAEVGDLKAQIERDTDAFVELKRSFDAVNSTLADVVLPGESVEEVVVRLVEAVK